MKRILLAKKLKKLSQTKSTAGMQQLCRSIHPARVADVLTKFFPQHVCEILAVVEAQTRAGIFCYLPQALQIKTVEFFKRNTLIETIAHLPADRRADFFNQLSAEKQEVVLPALAHAERENILKLTAHPPGAAGAVMTSDYAILWPELTASAAIAKLRHEAPDKETIYYAYAWMPAGG